MSEVGNAEIGVGVEVGSEGLIRHYVFRGLLVFTATFLFYYVLSFLLVTEAHFIPPSGVALKASVVASFLSTATLGLLYMVKLSKVLKVGLTLAATFLILTFYPYLAYLVVTRSLQVTFAPLLLFLKSGEFSSATLDLGQLGVILLAVIHAGSLKNFVRRIKF